MNSYDSINLGTPKPTSAKMIDVKVEISAETLIEPYAVAFISEAHRVNPLKAEQVNLEKQELMDYSRWSLVERVQDVHLQSKGTHKRKCLYQPAFVNHCLCQIGEVIDRREGLRFIPVVNDAEPLMSFEQALEVSEKIGSFQDDLQVIRDGFPRTIDGNPDVMMTAMIDGYMRSHKEVSHVVSTYISRFLGLKLQEQQIMSMLYRIQYDDIDFVRMALTTQKELFL